MTGFLLHKSLGYSKITLKIDKEWLDVNLTGAESVSLTPDSMPI